MSRIAELLSPVDEGYERKLWGLMVVLILMSVIYPLAVHLDFVRYYRLTTSVVLVAAAYSVSGNEGVDVHLRNGSSVMIGSREPRKLAHALQEAMKGSYA